MVQNEYNSDLVPIDCGVPEGSVLGPLIFLVYTDDLPKAIQHSKVHHFADDTCLFHTSKSVKNLNKLVDHNMKYSNNSLSANKSQLKKLLIFKSPWKYILMK